MSEQYVILKLVSGETLMATLIETSKYVTKIKDPVSLKFVHVNTSDGLVEKTVTSPYCPFAEDNEFSLSNEHVLFVKNLHASISAVYISLMESVKDSYGLTDDRYYDEYESDKPDDFYSTTDEPDKILH